MTDSRFCSRFAHERLDAYRVALELFLGVEQMVLPKGHADLRDQLRRATAATVRHIAEAANRTHPRDKAARFIVAQGECGECAAVLEMAEALRLAPVARLQGLRQLAGRVGAMLTGLIRRQRARADSAAP
jgi:four helix bundle protein